MKIEKLLKKYELLDDNIKRIDYHMRVLWQDSKEISSKIFHRNDLEEKELAVAIYSSILKCDYENPEYDKELDVEMTRFGASDFQYDKNRPQSPWTKSKMIDDSDYGVSKMFTDRVDDEMDFQNDYEHFMK